MIVVPMLLAAAIHVPAGYSDGSWWSDYVAVEPGKRYRLEVWADEGKSEEFRVYPFLYDEDGWLLENGEYAKNVATFAKYIPGAQKNPLVATELEPTPDTRFVRMLFYANGNADLNVKDWALAGCGPGKTVKRERDYAKSPWCIVIPERVSEEIDYAAKELQHWIKEVGGERPLIVKAKPLPGKKAIYFGRDFLDRDSGPQDSWIITRKNGNIHLVANDDRGLINAAFDLLERNTDIIFARSEANAGTVFTKTNGIRFDDCEAHVIPAYGLREFGLNGDPDFLMRVWQRRNYCNVGNIGRNRLASRGLCRLMFGPESPFYEYGNLIPNERYFRVHPEYFGLKDGKRIPYEHYGVQPCYTCREGQEAMADNLVSHLRKDVGPGVTSVSLGFGDTWALCRCPNCIKPITLPSGRVLTEEDAEFRSCQYYRFMLAIVEKAAREFPQLRFETLGYLYSAVPPPEMKLPSRLSVRFCPYPKCCRVPVYDDVKNKRWHDRSEAWARSGADIGIYEYYGNAMGSARPGSDMAQKDLQYWSKLGFHSLVYTEMPTDVRHGDELDRNAARWDFGLMESWVMTRLFVDPKRDVEKLRDDFCRRAYHEGAPMMRRFFSVIRDEWFKNPKYQSWSEEITCAIGRYVRDKGRTQELRQLLVNAEAAAKHPNSRLLIRQTLTRFDRVLEELVKQKPDAEEIPLKGKVYETKVGETRFKVWHDNAKLYVAFDAPGPIQPDASGVEAEHFPFGSGVGVVIRPDSDTAKYYHFLVTPEGRRYDARGYDLYWNCEGLGTQVKKTEAGWRGLMAIPLSDVGVNPTLARDVFICFAATPLQANVHDAQAHRPFKLELR